MKIQRRQFLQLAQAPLSRQCRASLGQAYRTRPVRVIIGFGPGGVVDIVA
jgi:tripartite-type tricarboxylate transporter receptor subunit TctC